MKKAQFLKFTSAAKKRFVELIKSGCEQDMTPAFVVGLGVKVEYSEDSIFEYHAKHYWIGNYKKGDVDPVTVRNAFGYKVSIAENVAKELSVGTIDIIDVLDMNTGLSQSFFQVMV